MLRVLPFQFWPVLLIGIVTVRALAAQPVPTPAPIQPAPQPTPAPPPAAAPSPAAAVPPPPSTSEVALACATVTTILQDEYAAEKDPDKQAEILKRADARIRSLLLDPRVDSVEAWRLAGVIAQARKDEGLAALAFEAISRLKPDYAIDENLLKVMARLDAMGARDRLNDVAKSRTNILEELWNRAHAGNPRAQTNLGVAYDYGTGVPKDQRRSVDWYTKAADQGFVPAIYNLGMSYRSGGGVPQNYAEAARLMRIAASASDESIEYAVKKVHLWVVP